MYQNVHFDNRKHKNKPIRARSQSPNFNFNTIFDNLFTNNNSSVSNQNKINENKSVTPRDQSPTIANFKDLSLNSPVTNQNNSIKNKRKSPLIEIDTNPKKKNLTGNNLINKLTTYCQVKYSSYILIKRDYVLLIFLLNY